MIKNKSLIKKQQYLVYQMSFKMHFQLAKGNRHISTLRFRDNYSWTSQNRVLGPNSPCEIYYKQIICRDMILKFNYNNIMQLPAFQKIVVNTTSKIYVTDKKYMIPALTALEMITGQKLIINQAKRSIATFKIRKGQAIGCKVTLRNPILYSFLYKLILIILPRSREFTGLSTQNISNSGNWSIAITNVMLFPELENYYEFFETVRGFNVAFGTSAKNKQQACVLYSALQIPIS
jgi:large subunit ribosomal protein L5